MCKDQHGTCPETKNTGHHTHHHGLFADEHADKLSQFSDAPVQVRDSECVAKIRECIRRHGENAARLKELGDALCFQLRYKEAIECYSRALALSPDDAAIKRKLAVRYLTTLDFCRAKKLFEECHRVTEDKLDTAYRLALLAFYTGDYAKAKRLFWECVPLCRDSGEMYVAAIYWLLLSEVKRSGSLGEVKQSRNCDEATPGGSVGDILSLYRGREDCGHHRGYYLTVKLFEGTDADCILREAEEDALTAVIVYYGAYHYYLHIGDAAKAEKMLSSALAADEYWASFVYIAVYSECMREKI